MKQALALLGKLGSFTGWGASGGGEGFIDIRRGSDPQTTWQNNPHGKEKLFPSPKSIILHDRIHDVYSQNLPCVQPRCCEDSSAAYEEET